MSRQANPMAVGGFVIGAVILVIAAALVFGTGRLFQERFAVVAFFPGSVKGLEVGAPVEFQGVRLGAVTDIQALFNPNTLETAIAVYMEMEKGRVTRMGEAKPDPKSDLSSLIDKGLRAQLEFKSLVTGQLIVTLDYFPDKPVVLRHLDEGYLEIPTVESAIDRLGRMLADVDMKNLTAKAAAAFDAIATAVSNPELEALVREGVSAVKAVDKLMVDGDDLAVNLNARVTTMADRLEATLADAQKLALSLDSKVEPLSSSAIGAMDQGKSTLATAEGMISENSNTRQRLDMALQELAEAARSVRVLADYLQQNPDALLKGKGY
jgi:phospholipid/cholesterol/gamma-HCH transport system substrate-binding protein